MLVILGFFKGNIIYIFYPYFWNDCPGQYDFNANNFLNYGLQN